MSRATPTERLAMLAEQAGVEIRKPGPSVALDVYRDGQFLTTCENVYEAIKFVGELYPVGFQLMGSKGPEPARRRY